MAKVSSKHINAKSSTSRGRGVGPAKGRFTKQSGKPYKFGGKKSK
jgi:hypothetical protein